jgi:4-carboxymuconolactone decarboxylase
MIELTAEEARVVGALAEKALATPQYYPLTANALLAACNQSNNREPVVTYDAATVETAMQGLRERGFARVIPAGGGNRTTKYRHVLDEALGLDARELALLTVLLLRGPQTLNELRTRTERLADFDGAEAVEHDLQRLAGRDEPLVVFLEREPGRREPRWATTLVATERAGRSSGSARPANGPRTPRSVRVAPLGDDELDDQQRELLAGVLAAGPTQNIFRTLARHPGLFRKWMPFGGKLLNGKLPARERELAILRVGWLCRSDYEWGQHVPIGRRAGLTDEEIARIPAGPAAPEWSGLDRAILSATDELHDESCITDATWARLAAEFDDKQLIELVMCVGQYHLVSFALNTFGVQREEGVVGLPDA